MSKVDCFQHLILWKTILRTLYLPSDDVAPFLDYFQEQPTNPHRSESDSPWFKGKQSTDSATHASTVQASMDAMTATAGMYVIMTAKRGTAWLYLISFLVSPPCPPCPGYGGLPYFANGSSLIRLLTMYMCLAKKGDIY